MKTSITQTTDSRLEDFLSIGCSYFNFHECSVAIIKHSPEEQLISWHSNKENLIFKVGSLTKVVTALAVLQLAEKPAFDLNDQVCKYLKWLPGRDVTVLDLLMHTSGLPRGVPHYSNPGRRKLLMELKDWQQMKPQVKSYKYSNLGYILLGKIIEVVTCMSYADYVQKEIFNPLGMTDSGFGNSGDKRFTIPHALSCFSENSKSPFECSPIPLLSAPEASFDMYSTTGDLSKLMSCLLNKGTYAGKSVLTPGSIQVLFSSSIPISGHLNSGIGLLHIKTRTSSCFFLSAEHWGHSASMLLIPEKQLGLVTMANRSSAGSDLLHLLQTVKRYLQGDISACELNFNYSNPELITGLYKNEQGDVLQIESRRGMNFARLNQGHVTPLIYKGQQCFILKTAGLSQYLMRLHMVRQQCTGIYIGPHYFEKAEHKDVCSKPRFYQSIAGIYTHPINGRIALFERKGLLILAYSSLQEATLREVTPGVFQQENGPFSNERIHINRSRKEILIGDLKFRHTQRQY